MYKCKMLVMTFCKSVLINERYSIEHVRINFKVKGNLDEIVYRYGKYRNILCNI